jgi:UDP-N-acetylmuramoyl-L-alanyl-D-glutamate--2,6-diaminopimelate ligase
MEYRNLNSFTILGIGGKGAYYIAKYLLLLGKSIIGYDLKSNERTLELEKLGAKITYSNPDLNSRFTTEGYIYSNDLPPKLQNSIHSSNSGLPALEVGEMYHKIVDDYEDNGLTGDEVRAFKQSNIAPLYDIDTDKMKYIAVTGTDGKTTTCTMIYHLLKKNGFKPALVTTVSAKIGEDDIDTGFHTTTPSSQEVYALIKKAEDASCTHMILETTSHGLLQGRIMGLKFDAVGYTNITEEHLDYHKSWENLAFAKSLLIRKHTKLESKVVLNTDDSRSFGYLKDLHRYLSYSTTDNSADYLADKIEESDHDIQFTLSNKKNSVKVTIPILGRYNVSNFLAACGVVNSLENMSLEKISEGIRDFETIRGRMEVIQTAPFTVIVDYAHTPNALENVLKSVKKLTSGKIINVFGSAGQRDFYKRPIMGKISNENSDITILTAEDPRLESLAEINDQIESGWKEGNNKEGQLIRFDDISNNVAVRRDAIQKALDIARDGDLVIITGKAHEMSLCFSQTEYPWNDIDEVKKLLNS